MSQSRIFSAAQLELDKRRRHFQWFQEMLGAEAFAPSSKRPMADCFDTDGGWLARPSAERAVVWHLLGSIISEKRPSVLELLGGAGSCLPPWIEASRVVGFGRVDGPRVADERLTERIARDLSSEEALPFEDESFDVVVSAFTVPYLRHAERLVDELGRVLRPGGLLALVFDDAFEAEHAIRYWSSADVDERTMLVEEYIGQSRHFHGPRVFTHPLSSPDEEGTSPVYLVYAEKRGPSEAYRMRPAPSVSVKSIFTPEEVAQRKRRVAETHECPYCGESMSDVAVTASPWGGWGAELLYVCLNDACPYRLQSVGVLAQQGVRSHCYRALLHPETGQLSALPCPLNGGKVLPRRLTRDH